jgi:hypothetical protein
MIDMIDTVDTGGDRFAEQTTISLSLASSFKPLSLEAR